MGVKDGLKNKKRNIFQKDNKALFFTKEKMFNT